MVGYLRYQEVMVPLLGLEWEDVARNQLEIVLDAHSAQNDLDWDVSDDFDFGNGTGSMPQHPKFGRMGVWVWIWISCLVLLQLALVCIRKFLEVSGWVGPGGYVDLIQLGIGNRNEDCRTFCTEV